MTLGVRPTYPATIFGYLELGDEAKQGIFRMKRFKEKPDIRTARKFVKAWNFLWNGGIFIYPLKTFWPAYEKHLPKQHKILSTIANSYGKKTFPGSLKRNYKLIPKISIDFGLMEKLDAVYTAPLKANWTDVGGALELSKELDDSQNENTVEGKALLHQTKNAIVINTSDKPVVTLGADDLIIFSTDKATLVAKKDKVPDWKSMIEAREKEFIQGFAVAISNRRYLKLPFPIPLLKQGGE